MLLDPVVDVRGQCGPEYSPQRYPMPEHLTAPRHDHVVDDVVRKVVSALMVMTHARCMIPLSGEEVWRSSRRRSGEAEFLHLLEQRSAFDSQAGSGALGAPDQPMRVPEGRKDMLALDLLERPTLAGYAGSGRRHVCRRQVQDGTW